MTTWDKGTFSSASEWIIASAPTAPEKYVDALATIAKRRKGIYTILRGAPKDSKRRLIWEGFRIAKHSMVWGDLSAWTESTTRQLMIATEADQELFHYILDTTLELAKARKA
jgi:hypothetical protein